MINEWWTNYTKWKTIQLKQTFELTISLTYLFQTLANDIVCLLLYYSLSMCKSLWHKAVRDGIGGKGKVQAPIKRDTSLFCILLLYY